MGTFRVTNQQASPTNTVTFTLFPKNTNVCNGFIFSTSWSDPATPLRGSIYWIRIRTQSDENVGVYQMFINTSGDEQTQMFTISSVSYNVSSGLLTITYQSSGVRFTEIIYG